MANLELVKNDVKREATPLATPMAMVFVEDVNGRLVRVLVPQADIDRATVLNTVPRKPMKREELRSMRAVG